MDATLQFSLSVIIKGMFMIFSMKISASYILVLCYVILLSQWRMKTPKLDDFRNRYELELLNMNFENNLYYPITAHIISPLNLLDCDTFLVFDVVLEFL